jgi:hypothetical protein
LAQLAIILPIAAAIWMVQVHSQVAAVYFAVLAVNAAYGLLMTELLRLDLWMPLRVAIGMFAMLSIFSVLGGALYERRHRLGLQTWHSPEQVAEAYGHVRIGSHAKAWVLLQSWLEARDNAPEAYRWLCERVSSWNDARYANRLTAGHVARLLSLKRNGEALDAVARALLTDFATRFAAHKLVRAGDRLKREVAE